MVKTRKSPNAPKKHHYTECGLDNVWIEGGFEIIDSPYGAGVSIQDMDGLHECIARCLIEKPGPLSGKEFRFLRTELDMSQSTMGALCGREERMVRNWETGDKAVDEPANTLIRFIYLQHIKPSANFVGFSQKIRQIQALDKQIHEWKLKSTPEGWKPDDQREVA
jgi:DNA-binding transcriptional regulator YiaG